MLVYGKVDSQQPFSCIFHRNSEPGENQFIPFFLSDYCNRSVILFFPF